MTNQLSKIEYKSLGLIVDFDLLSCIIYCTTPSNGETWKYDSYQSYYEEMGNLLYRAGFNIKASIN